MTKIQGDTAFVQYDKTLEARQRNKRYMEPLWRANGWDGQASVTRNEVRWRRGAFRNFAVPGKTQEDLDDPWVFVRRLPVYWRYTVGSAPPTTQEAHERLAQGISVDAACAAAASEVDVAWIRRVTPVEGDTNRSRWPTDPIWRVVQSAVFSDADPSARRLMRRAQRRCSVKHLDAGAYGYLVSRTAYLHPDGESWDISWAARELVGSLGQIAEAPDKDFGQLVRERRRLRGLPVAPAPSILPDLPLPPSGQDAEALRALDAAAEHMLTSDVRNEDFHTARMQLAGHRLHEALIALEDAQQRDDTPEELRQLEAIYLQELSCYEALRRTQEETLPGAR
jgi:hypothetical protein